MANYEPDVGFAWWLMENFWVRFAEVARARGLSPLIAYPVGGEIPGSILAAGIETVVVPFPGEGREGLGRALALIRERRVRCIYFTDRTFTRFAYLLFRLSGVRLILNHDHVPGDHPPARGAKRLAKTVLRRLPLVNCDLQLCVSPLIRDRAVATARIPRGRAVVVQNGIEPFECGDASGYASHALGIPEGARICMTVGRAHPNKRIEFVVEVARRCIVEAGVAGLWFVHCGDGPELDRLRALAERAGLGERFIFAGRRSDVRALLCSADLALHAARGEAFSLAILEYMSAGLAVLVPDIPTVCQAVRHGETGIVFRDGDPEGAAAELAALCADDGRRARLGRAAAAEVRECYSLERMNHTFRVVAGGALDAASVGSGHR